MSEKARNNFWELAEKARTQGRDLAEVLDKAGVLLTEERIKVIQSKVLYDLAEMLATSSVKDWSDQRVTNPEVARAVIAQRIKDMAFATGRVGWKP